MKEANLEGNDLRHLDDPKQRESTCKCKSHEKQAWGLCSLSTKTNLIFFLYQENHRMILAKYGGEGEIEWLRILQISYFWSPSPVYFTAAKFYTQNLDSLPPESYIHMNHPWSFLVFGLITSFQL